MKRANKRGQLTAQAERKRMPRGLGKIASEEIRFGPYEENSLTGLDAAANNLMGWGAVAWMGWDSMGWG